MKVTDLRVVPFDVCERMLSAMMYCPDRGRFVRTSGKEPELMKGYDRVNNYWKTTFEGKVYFQHRMAFLFMTGKFPDLFIDHIDRDSSNNEWSNLRQCSHWENLQNRDWCHVPRYSGRFTALGLRGVAMRYHHGDEIAPPGLYYEVMSPSEEGLIVGATTDFFVACCARKSLENKAFVKLESMDPVKDTEHRIMSGLEFDKLFC